MNNPIAKKTIDNVADNWFTGERITESENIGSEIPIKMNSLVNLLLSSDRDLENKYAADR